MEMPIKVVKKAEALVIGYPNRVFLGLYRAVDYCLHRQQTLPEVCHQNTPRQSSICKAPYIAPVQFLTGSPLLPFGHDTFMYLWVLWMCLAPSRQRKAKAIGLSLTFTNEKLPVVYHNKL